MPRGAIAIAVCLAIGAPGCDGGSSALEGVEPTEALAVEPDYVKVDHILVAVKSDRMPQVTRTESEARALVAEIMGKLETGDDWEKLKAAHSDDKSGGAKAGSPYAMSNSGVPPRSGDTKRTGMVPGFGNVGFKLRPGQVGVAEFNAATSPFGFHIIKRLE